MISLHAEIEIKKVQSLIHNKLSPFRSAVAWPYLAGAQSDSSFTFTFSPTRPEIYGASASIAGGASGCNPRETLVKAMAEACERYAASFVPSARTIKAKTFLDLSKNYSLISPENFNLNISEQYAAKDFHFVPYTRELVQDWHLVKNLVQNTETVVPLSMISFEETTPRIQDVTTSGVAAGESAEFAILNGLLELIERDAFCFYWKTLLAPCVLNKNEISELYLLKPILSSLSPGVWDHIEFVYMPTDINIPTVAVMYFGRDPLREPGFCVSAAASFSLERSIVKALEEFLNIFGYVHRFYEKYDSTLWAHVDPDNRITDFVDHAHYYFNYENAALIRSWILDQSTVPVPQIKDLGKILNPADGLQRLSHHLWELGFAPLACDLTTRDVEKLGVHVYRTLVPGLLQMEGPHKHRFLGGRRLYSLGQKLGLIDRDLNIDEINQAPHPFA